MPEQILQYALVGAFSGLATVLWWLGRKVIASLDAVDKEIRELKLSVTNEIAALRVSVANDMGSVRERLARLEGHAGIGK